MGGNISESGAWQAPMVDSLPESAKVGTFQAWRKATGEAITVDARTFDSATMTTVDPSTATS